MFFPIKILITYNSFYNHPHTHISDMFYFGPKTISKLRHLLYWFYISIKNKFIKFIKKNLF
jgi:hypothetical protein